MLIARISRRIWPADESEEINAILSNIRILLISPVEIAIAGADIDRQRAASWVAEIMCHATPILAHHGGIRRGVSITKGEPVTYGRVFR